MPRDRCFHISLEGRLRCYALYCPVQEELLPEIVVDEVTERKYSAVHPGLMLQEGDKLGGNELERPFSALCMSEVHRASVL